jgi:hypothetical protein
MAARPPSKRGEDSRELVSLYLGKKTVRKWRIVEGKHAGPEARLRGSVVVKGARYNVIEAKDINGNWKWGSDGPHWEHLP